MIQRMLAWAARVVRRPRHVKPVFYRSRHRQGWAEVTQARRAAEERLVATLDDLFALQVG